LTAKIYLNGNLEASWAAPFIYDPNTSPLLIGVGSGSYFDGAIDDLAIYNRAFDQAEITSRYGANLVSAMADDPSSNGKGIQAGDRVVIKFNGATDGATINAANIDSALNLGGNSWLDGSGNIGSAAWSTDVKTNDTLTVTLSSTSGLPTITVGDTVSLDGTIKDTSARPIIGAVVVAGTFDSLLSGTVAYWNFDEGTSNTAYDASGNGNDGAITGGPPWISGKDGTALDLRTAFREGALGDNPYGNKPRLTYFILLSQKSQPIKMIQITAQSSDHRVVIRHGKRKTYHFPPVLCKENEVRIQS